MVFLGEESSDPLAEVVVSIIHNKCRPERSLIDFMLACFYFIKDRIRAVTKQNAYCVYTNVNSFSQGAAVGGNSMISSLAFGVWLCSIQVFIPM